MPGTSKLLVGDFNPHNNLAKPDVVPIPSPGIPDPQRHRKEQGAQIATMDHKLRPATAGFAPAMWALSGWLSNAHLQSKLGSCRKSTAQLVSARMGRVAPQLVFVRMGKVAPQLVLVRMEREAHMAGGWRAGLLPREAASEPAMSANQQVMHFANPLMKKGATCY